MNREDTLKKNLRTLLSKTGIDLKIALYLIQEYIFDKKSVVVTIIPNLQDPLESKLFANALDISVQHFCSQLSLTIVQKEGKVIAIC